MVAQWPDDERMMNMEQSSAELIERLKCLERKQADLQRTNRRLGSVMGALLLMTGALVLMGQTGRQPQSLDAEQFVLLGPDGKVRGAMGITPDGAVGLNLDDVKGQTRITLDVAPNGSPRSAGAASTSVQVPVSAAAREDRESARRRCNIGARIAPAPDIPRRSW